MREDYRKLTGRDLFSRFQELLGTSPPQVSDWNEFYTSWLKAVSSISSIESGSSATLLLNNELLREAELPGVCLRFAELNGANLMSADLSGADLQCTSLIGANLKGANLSNTNLESAHLVEADLCEANLTHATLFNAVLYRAKLNEAKLCGAKLGDPSFKGTNLFFPDPAHVDLRESQFRGAQLNNACLFAAVCHSTDFTDADLQGADLRKADLTQARFIRSTMTDVEISESVVGDVQIADIRGVPKSTSSLWLDSKRENSLRPNLALSFFEDFDVGQKELLKKISQKYHSCFISYSHADSAFAHKLYDCLCSAGISSWLDVRDLLPGDRILDKVGAGLEQNDRILICCSQASLTSWWVKDEIRKAQELERKSDCDLIIPLNLDDFLFSWKDGLATDIRSRLVADFRDWNTKSKLFESEFTKLLRALLA